MSNAYINPQVYVTTLLKFSEGDHTGLWVELADYENKDAFLKACHAFHSDELYPELMFQSWQDVPQSFQDETTFNEDIFDYFEAIETFNQEQTKAFEIFIDKVSNSLDYVATMITRFQEAYCGYFAKDFLKKPRVEFAHVNFENLGLSKQIPDNLISYFDFDAYARDLFIGDYAEHEGYVFSRF